MTCDYVSVRNCPGVGEELLSLIEIFMKHVSWTVFHALTEIQRPPVEEIFTTMKNYGEHPPARSCACAAPEEDILLLIILPGFKRTSPCQISSGYPAAMLQGETLLPADILQYFQAS